MLRHRRLRDRELTLNGCSDGSRRLLAVDEQFQNSTPYRVAQDVECVHSSKVEAFTYISQVYI